MLRKQAQEETRTRVNPDWTFINQNFEIIFTSKCPILTLAWVQTDLFPGAEPQTASCAPWVWLCEPECTDTGRTDGRVNQAEERLNEMQSVQYVQCVFSSIKHNRCFDYQERMRQRFNKQLYGYDWPALFLTDLL